MHQSLSSMLLQSKCQCCPTVLPSVYMLRLRHRDVLFVLLVPVGFICIFQQWQLLKTVLSEKATSPYPKSG